MKRPTICRLNFIGAISFVETFEQMSNPFLATSPELVALYTQYVMRPGIAASLSLIADRGEISYVEYTTERLENPIIPVSDSFPYLNIFTFANRPIWTRKISWCPDTKYDTHHTTASIALITPRCQCGNFFCYENQENPKPGWPWNTSKCREVTGDRLYLISNWTYGAKHSSHRSCSWKWPQLRTWSNQLIQRHFLNNMWQST